MNNETKEAWNAINFLLDRFSTCWDSWSCGSQFPILMDMFDAFLEQTEKQQILKGYFESPIAARGLTLWSLWCLWHQGTISGGFDGRWLPLLGAWQESHLNGEGSASGEQAARGLVTGCYCDGFWGWFFGMFSYYYGVSLSLCCSYHYILLWYIASYSH